MIPENWAERPPPRWGKIFWHQIYPFQAILSNFGFCGRKATPTQDEGKCFNIRSIQLQAILSNFGFCGRKATPTQDEGNFFNIGRSIQFRQFWATLVFVAEKPTPPRMRENFFDIRSIHFRQFWATLVFVAEMPPPPRMRENFWTSDLSISGNFEQLWFLWQKSPPPSLLSFCQGLGSHYTGRIPKVPILTNPYQIPAIQNFYRLPTLVNFVAEIAPPQDEGKFLAHQIYIHFRQFWATLVFVAEKPPPPGWGKIF